MKVSGHIYTQDNTAGEPFRGTLSKLWRALAGTPGAIFQDRHGRACEAQTSGRLRWWLRARAGHLIGLEGYQDRHLGETVRLVDVTRHDVSEGE